MLRKSFNIHQIAHLLTKNICFYRTITNEVTITENCIKKIEEKRKDQNIFLRLTVESGEGCSGFKYHFNFDTAINDEIDFVFERDGKKYLAIDDLTLKLVKGSLVEYESEMIKSAFQVLKNPNAEKSCSCKVSFSPKPDLL